MATPRHLPYDRDVTRVLAVLAAVVVLLMLGGTALAADLPPGGTFVDDDDTSQEGWIEALYAEGITKGCNPPDATLYCGEDTVTRAEAASFFTRLLGLPAGPDVFVDDGASIHEGPINALAAADITRGCNPPDNDWFCPERTLTRREMAAMIVRAADWADANGVPDVRSVPAQAANPFVDTVGSIFEDDIARLAASEITRGCSDDEFCPDDPMLRKHLAVFLGRLAELEPIQPPARPRQISTFSTYHNCCESRVTNIHVMARDIDGWVVQPGDTFSLNQAAGPRTTAKGYVPAGAIIGGEVYCCDHPVNIGGGVSQVATTLFNAAYFAGLEIVSHQPHSIYFSRYPLGREATVVYPSPDLVFRNDTNTPLTIDMSWSSTRITATLIGFNNFRRVSSTTEGSATTANGGSTKLTRVITFRDGSTKTEVWYWTYNPLA